MDLSTNHIIITDENSVAARLNEHFNVTREELIHIVNMAVGARRDSTLDDPATAPGTLSYIYGTRGLRTIFRPKGWMSLRENGIESVFLEPSNIRIIFQNVDHASDLYRTPKAISKKRSASKNLINTAQGDLFVSFSTEHSPRQVSSGEVWYLCVSCDEQTGIRAELSRPTSLQDEQFINFHERILIVKKGDLEDIQQSNTFVMPEQDYDIQISRK